MRSLSSVSSLSFAFICNADPGSTTSRDVKCSMPSAYLIQELSLESSESSESMNTSVGLFSFSRPKSIPSTSLEALTTQALLT